MTTAARLTPQDLSRLSLEELLALGVCECGVRLDVHPPLPRPGVWGGWTSQRVTPPEFRSGSSLVDEARMSERQEAYRRQMGGAISKPEKRWGSWP